MARSAVTVVSSVRNASTAITKDAFDIANDHEIDCSIVSDNYLNVFIETLDTKAAVFTVVAGAGQAKGQGNLTVTTGAAGVKVLTLDTARFKGSDGLVLINITSTAGATGNIYAVTK